MLTDDYLHALLQARHPDPFAVLGLHADAQGALDHLRSRTDIDTENLFVFGR